MTPLERCASRVAALAERIREGRYPKKAYKYRPRVKLRDVLADGYPRLGCGHLAIFESKGACMKCRAERREGA